MDWLGPSLRPHSDWTYPSHKTLGQLSCQPRLAPTVALGVARAQILTFSLSQLCKFLKVVLLPHLTSFRSPPVMSVVYDKWERLVAACSPGNGIVTSLAWIPCPMPLTPSHSPVSHASTPSPILARGPARAFNFKCGNMIILRVTRSLTCTFSTLLTVSIA